MMRALGFALLVAAVGGFVEQQAVQAQSQYRYLPTQPRATANKRNAPTYQLAGQAPAGHQQGALQQVGHDQDPLYQSVLQQAGHQQETVILHKETYEPPPLPPLPQDHQEHEYQVIEEHPEQEHEHAVVECDTCEEEEAECDACQEEEQECACECEDEGCGWCNIGDPIDFSNLLLGEDAAFDFGGWVAFGGYHTDDNLQFLDQPDRFNFTQVWGYIERKADGSEGFDIGGRVDIMYGIDADDTQAFGGPAGTWDFLNGWDAGGGYGWAMPQLYGEVAYGDFSVIGGHFYTLVGYEVVTAPDNFFYSHSLTMFNSEPFTHTGVLASYSGIDNVTLYGGWVAGWDTGFTQFADGSAFKGGASFQVGDNLSITYIFLAGNLGFRGEGYNHSIVVDWQISERLNYVLQSDLVATDGSFPNPANQNAFIPGVINDQDGINQYLFYKINDCLSVGTRFEYWNSDSVDNWEWTYGLNVRPHANLVIRPEVIHRDVETLGGNTNNTIFAVDGVLTF